MNDRYGEEELKKRKETELMARLEMCCYQLGETGSSRLREKIMNVV